MTERRFAVMGLACGATKLLRSRLAEHRAKRGLPPSHLVLHVPTTRRLFSELCAEAGKPFDEAFVRPGCNGKIDGVPFFVCSCGEDLAEDQIYGQDGMPEPL